MSEKTSSGTDREITQRTMRVGMLALIAALCVASIADWIHHDLSTMFVLVIALIGIGTRGSVLDSVFVVAVEAAAVVMLAVATFTSSDAFLHAASSAVAVIAIGKIALLQIVAPAPTDGTKKERPVSASAPETAAAPPGRDAA
ncbi:hypothetical protein [Sandaracinus amylolyticus]|uniref:hypothetical protein n=1 Tax=Sandaracinus amylolyticus TaxID=927083 RepID=UPI001F430B6B|nr:hypothetical protein [Sandaracinus amylolyticus]UJR80850.1 Hypothetical protein I5071_29000 [Sandaracinus amylolyticus]